MADIRKRLRILALKGAADGQLSIYDANAIDSILSIRPATASAIELVELSRAAHTALGAELISEAQLDSIFEIVPELERA